MKLMNVKRERGCRVADGVIDMRPIQSPASFISSIYALSPWSDAR
jgi:hypothetical protein